MERSATDIYKVFTRHAEVYMWRHTQQNEKAQRDEGSFRKPQS